MNDKKPVPPALAEFALEQLAEAGEPNATNRAEELITQLEAEIVKRDARIVELEAFADHANAQMLEAFAELEQQRGGVVLPERELYTRYMPGVIPSNAVEVNSYRDGWNACLDEVARLNPCRAQAVPDGLLISSEGVEHLKHARRELTRMDRAPLYIRQALAEKITAMLADAPSAQQKDLSDE